MPHRNPTPEEASGIKTVFLKRQKTLGAKDEAPVFQKTLTKRGLVFLYTWLTRATDAKIVGSEGYQKLFAQDPRKAEEYRQLQVLQECVLWPTDFAPSDQVYMGEYPAGVVSGLYRAIQEDSALFETSGNDKIIAKPDEVEPADEEMAQLVAANEFARRFGMVGHRLFVLREPDTQTGLAKVIPLKHFFFSAVDRETYQTAMSMPQEEGMRFLVKAALIWPRTVDFGKEPTGYLDWLFNAVMVLSGFTEEDPSIELSGLIAPVAGSSEV